VADGAKKGKRRHRAPLIGDLVKLNLDFLGGGAALGRQKVWWWIEEGREGSFWFLVGFSFAFD
jgi:hypothetical protein